MKEQPRPGGESSFLYLRDPLFLGASILYGINRYALRPRLGPVFPFLRNHWNDCFLIPCALPVLLWLFRKAGLRPHDEPPTLGEILKWTVLWSLLFELIFPRFFHWGTADWRDCLSYVGGAFVSGLVWNKSRIHAASLGPYSNG